MDARLRMLKRAVDKDSSLLPVYVAALENAVYGRRPTEITPAELVEEAHAAGMTLLVEEARAAGMTLDAVLDLLEDEGEYLGNGLYCLSISPGVFLTSSPHHLNDRIAHAVIGYEHIELDQFDKWSRQHLGTGHSGSRSIDLLTLHGFVG